MNKNKLHTQLIDFRDQLLIVGRDNDRKRKVLVLSLLAVILLAVLNFIYQTAVNYSIASIYEQKVDAYVDPVELMLAIDRGEMPFELIDIRPSTDYTVEHIRGA